MKTCDFRASAASEKLKQDAQTQVADAIQSMSVLYMAQLEAIPQHHHHSWEEVTSECPAPHDSNADRHRSL